MQEVHSHRPWFICKLNMVVVLRRCFNGGDFVASRNEWGIEKWWGRIVYNTLRVGIWTYTSMWTPLLWAVDVEENLRVWDLKTIMSINEKATIVAVPVGTVSRTLAHLLLSTWFISSGSLDYSRYFFIVDAISTLVWTRFHLNCTYITTGIQDTTTLSKKWSIVYTVASIEKKILNSNQSTRLQLIILECQQQEREKLKIESHQRIMKRKIHPQLPNPHKA